MRNDIVGIHSIHSGYPHDTTQVHKRRAREHKLLVEVRQSIIRGPISTGFPRETRCVLPNPRVRRNSSSETLEAGKRTNAVPSIGLQVRQKTHREREIHR